MRIEREGKMKGELQMELFLPASHFQEDLEKDKPTLSLPQITPNSSGIFSNRNDSMIYQALLTGAVGTQPPQRNWDKTLPRFGSKILF